MVNFIIDFMVKCSVSCNYIPPLQNLWQTVICMPTYAYEVRRLFEKTNTENFPCGLLFSRSRFLFFARDYEKLLYELLVQIHELRVQIYELLVQITSYLFKFTSYLFKSTSYVFKSTSYVFKSTSYKFKSTS